MFCFLWINIDDQHWRSTLTIYTEDPWNDYKKVGSFNILSYLSSRWHKQRILDIGIIVGSGRVALDSNAPYLSFIVYWKWCIFPSYLRVHRYVDLVMKYMPTFNFAVLAAWSEPYSNFSVRRSCEMLRTDRGDTLVMTLLFVGLLLTLIIGFNLRMKPACTRCIMKMAENDINLSTTIIIAPLIPPNLVFFWIELVVRIYQSSFSRISLFLLVSRGMSLIYPLTYFPVFCTLAQSVTAKHLSLSLTNEKCVILSPLLVIFRYSKLFLIMYYLLRWSSDNYFGERNQAI